MDIADKAAEIAKKIEAGINDNYEDWLNIDGDDGVRSVWLSDGGVTAIAQIIREKMVTVREDIEFLARVAIRHEEISVSRLAELLNVDMMEARRIANEELTAKHEEMGAEQTGHHVEDIHRDAKPGEETSHLDPPGSRRP